VERMENELNHLRVPAFEAVAMDGKGVFSTLKSITKLMLNRAKGSE